MCMCGSCIFNINDTAVSLKDCLSGFPPTASLCNCDAAIHTGDYLNNKTQFSCFCFVSASHIQVGPDYVQAAEVFVCTVSADLCFISGDSPFI